MGLTILPKDLDREVIQAGSEVFVFNVSVSANTWAAITLPNDVDCKNVLVKNRDNLSYKLSHEADGDYITVNSELSLNIACDGGTTLFYVQTESDTVFEVLVLR